MNKRCHLFPNLPHRKAFFIAIESFFISWALMQAFRLSTKHLLSIVFFLFIYVFLEFLSQKTEEQEFSDTYNKTAVFLGAAFSFLYLCGDFEGLTVGLSNNFFRVFILAVCGIGFLLLFYKIILFLLLWREKHVLSCDNKNTFINKCSGKKVALGTVVLCILGWVPYLLKGFPGIITIDSTHQYAQILNIHEQSNHHPWIHTQLIKLFYHIGLIFTDDPSYAISFYTIFQMLFMAICVAYLMVSLHRKKLKNWVYLLVLCFYVLIPYNGAFAISMVKDVMFAGFVMLHTLALFSLLEKTKDGNSLVLSKNLSILLLYVFSGIGVCLFRSNGYYAFLFMIPFTIYAFRGNIKKIIPMQFMILLVVLLFKGPVMDAFYVVSPDLVEHLSIPGQQISRVLMNNRELTEEQSVYLNNIMDTSRIEEGYNPYVSDWFKRLVRMGNQDYLEENFGEFLKIYIEIGLEYPTDYFVAFRDQSIGYWFPLSDQDEISGNYGVVDNEFGLENKSILKGPLVTKINEIIFKLQNIFPFYGLIWSMGAHFWILLICMGIVFAHGNRRHLLLYLPAIGIFLTLLIATPVAKDFRYAYGYVFSMPLYLILSCLPNKSHT